MSAAAPAILLTRPAAESTRLATALAAEGWRPLVWPLLDIAPTGAVPDYAEAQAALLTSANAARHGTVGPVPAYCVGRATAAAARDAGWPTVESAEGDAAALADMVAARLDPAAGPLLFLRGETVAGDLGGTLRKRGFSLRETVVYAARPGGRPAPEVAAALAGGALAAAAFYSPRTAARFAEAAPALGARLGATRAVAISAAAADPLDSLGFSAVTVAARPDGPAMREAIRAIRG